MSRAKTRWARSRLDRAGQAVLLFGRMFEDEEVEAALFAPGSSVFCIASAGCTALGLAARGHDVTAVDINPAQVQYVRQRAAGGGLRPGRVDNLLGYARRTLAVLGISRDKLRAFLSLDDPATQLRAWDQEVETLAWRAALAGALQPRLLRAVAASPFLRALPPRFPRLLRARLRRGWARHPNRTNPYAWRLLLGEEGPTAPGPRHSALTVALADAAQYLESAPPGRFQAFSLSNVLDGADASYARRLWMAVRRAAAPGAVAVLRSVGQPAIPDEEEWAARDRALVWGSVRVSRVGG